jgi:hypothetical protein
MQCPLIETKRFADAGIQPWQRMTLWTYTLMSARPKQAEAIYRPGMRLLGVAGITVRNELLFGASCALSSAKTSSCTRESSLRVRR